MSALESVGDSCFPFFNQFLQSINKESCKNFRKEIYQKEREREKHEKTHTCRRENNFRQFVVMIETS